MTECDDCDASDVCEWSEQPRGMVSLPLLPFFPFQAMIDATRGAESSDNSRRHQFAGAHGALAHHGREDQRGAESESVSLTQRIIARIRWRK